MEKITDVLTWACGWISGCTDGPEPVTWREALMQAFDCLVRLLVVLGTLAAMAGIVYWLLARGAWPIA